LIRQLDLCIDIYNANRVLMETMKYESVKNFNKSICLNDYPNGIYFLKLSLGDGSVLFKKVLKIIQ
jgi:hypothetical protein